MARGPKGERRPADVNARAVLIAKIATGEAEEVERDPAKRFHREGGLKGGKARAASLTAEQRAAIARKAADARWNKK
jgi:hypothetical protein